MASTHHFSHPHLLEKIDSGERELVTNPCCACCSLPSSGLGLYCGRCDFYLHNSCKSQSRQISQIKHPFHPEHKLILHVNSPYKYGAFECCACGLEKEGFNYHCESCGWDLDLPCAMLMPTITNKNNNKMPQMIHHQINNPHPVIICENTVTIYDVFCSCCRRLIIQGDPICVCLECKMLMDESCARLPLVIKHPFHLQHPLTLLRKSKTNKYVCNACRKESEGFIFQCSECEFELDIGCASLIPATSNKSDDDDDDDEEHVMISHPHPLIHCYRTKSSFLPLVCSGCLLPLEKENPIYVCLDCRMLLHESCARLPRKIKHPLHPTHPLSLVDEISSDTTILICDACKNNCRSGFIYRCQGYCEFQLHLKCALPVFPLLNHELIHQHSLALLNCKETNLLCSICVLPCLTPFFRCVECNFNVHLHCLSVLPDSVKYQYHLHPLTLTHSPITDYDDEEDDAVFYCDSCEKYRQLNEPTYYCVECHYVAHVHCMISEVFPHLQREASTSLDDKLGKIKLDVVEEDKQGGKLQISGAKEDERELEVAILKTFLGAGTEDDDDQVMTTISTDGLSEEIWNIVGDSVLDELNTKIRTLQTRVDELNTEIRTLHTLANELKLVLTVNN